MKHLHWMKSALLAAAVLSLAALPLAAGSGGPAAGEPMSDHVMAMGDHHAMMAQHMHQIASQLNLSADQKAAAKQIMQDVHAQIQPLHQQASALHTQLETALGAATPDAAAVGQLVIQIHQIHQQIKPLFEAGMAKFQALLTPDQLAKFNELKAAHGSHASAGKAER